ncbi:MAG: hypothetical protein COA70_11975 [Planctomycetota bacterium]|nr:MAG: hypothetical protein COA70_11975 [Planctomycetota bacterium]
MEPSHPNKKSAARTFASAVLRMVHDLHMRHPDWCAVHGLGVVSSSGQLPTWTATLAQAAACQLLPVTQPRQFIDSVFARRWPLDSIALPEQLDVSEQVFLNESLAQESQRLHAQEKPSSRFQELQLTSSGGTDLPYLRVGSGKPHTVFWNALGQEVGMFLPMISCWPQEFGCLTWKARDSIEDAAPSFDQHEADLLAMLEATDADTIDIVAWCTAGKASLRFAARHPHRVRKIVLLQPAFRSNGARSEWKSEWETNMKTFVDSILARPKMAVSAATALRQFDERSAWEPTTLRRQPEQSAEAIWDIIPKSVARLVRKSWQDGSSTLNYLRQLDAFWQEDVAPFLSSVKAPVLVLSSQRDRISSSHYAAWAVKELGQSEYRVIPDASHYFLHESPELATSHALHFLQYPITHAV